MATGCLRSAAGEALPGKALISSDSTVVFLSGLPGDAESENAYQDQLQRWLDILSSRPVRKCIVFCDQPGLVSDSKKLAVQTIKGDREHFLKLPVLIGSRSDPVTVIIWGHGGKQGSTPVFHVRGPRLTPDDVSAVAGKLQSLSSRWILMFRGSGAFARALSRSGREILSSDEASMFSSDPAGLPVLIKLLKDNPESSLSQLGNRFGRATADWYAQRQLARTEDPAVWLDGQPPRRLANAQVDSDTPNAPEQASNSVVRSAVSSGEQSPTGSSPASPAGWDQIRKTLPQAYPDADAVVLQRNQVCHLGSDPALVTEREEFIQILRPEGKRFGDFDVAFEPPLEEVEFLTCEVLGPDGKLVRMDPDAIGTSGAHSLGDYQGARRKFFSLPGVMPGAVLHVRYRSQWKDYPMPHVTMEIPVARELPVISSVLEVRVPKDWSFHFAFEGLIASDPVVTRSAYASSYSWHWSDIAADTGELLAAPHHRPGLKFSTFKDWREFADWYSHITRLTDEISPEIVAKARELTHDATIERDKIQALYEYVNSLRYVAIPLGVSSVRPHSAANVLQNQFGDCKDKANLLNTLLRALNIKADLVLVPRFSQASDALPGLAFNHAISRVTSGSETLWLDPTDEVCRFGLLPPGDGGRNVLIIDGESNSLTPLAMPKPGQHRMVIHGKVGAPDLNGSCSIALTATGSGSADYQLRNEAHETRDHARSMPLLELRYRPVSGSFALEHQSTSLVPDMDRDFLWQGDGSCIGLAYVRGNQYTLHSPFWLPREWEIALNPRHRPLYLNDGYPLALEEEFEIDLPKQGETHELPGEAGNQQEPLCWHLAWTRAGQDKLVGHLRAELAQGEMSPAQSTKFQRQVRNMLAALASDAQVTLDPAASGMLNASQH